MVTFQQIIDSDYPLSLSVEDGDSGEPSFDGSCPCCFIACGEGGFCVSCWRNNGERGIVANFYGEALYASVNREKIIEAFMSMSSKCWSSYKWTLNINGTEIMTVNDD